MSDKPLLTRSGVKYLGMIWSRYVTFKNGLSLYTGIPKRDISPKVAVGRICLNVVNTAEIVQKRCKTKHVL